MTDPRTNVPIRYRIIVDASLSIPFLRLHAFSVHRSSGTLPTADDRAARRCKRKCATRRAIAFSGRRTRGASASCPKRTSLEDAARAKCSDSYGKRIDIFCVERSFDGLRSHVDDRNPYKCSIFHRKSRVSNRAGACRPESWQKATVLELFIADYHHFTANKPLPNF